MAKRGFFAELNYQAQQAEKRQRQQQASAVRAHNAAVRESERAAKAAERARLAAQRANEADRKAAEKEAKRLHIEAREAEVEEMNTDLVATYEEIDRLLEATLEVDDYVDLESLKSAAVHPEFAPGKLAEPIRPPLAPALRNAPVYARARRTEGTGWRVRRQEEARRCHRGRARSSTRSRRGRTRRTSPSGPPSTTRRSRSTRPPSRTGSRSWRRPRSGTRPSASSERPTPRLATRS